MDFEVISIAKTAHLARQSKLALLHLISISINYQGGLTHFPHIHVCLWCVETISRCKESP